MAKIRKKKLIIILASISLALLLIILVIAPCIAGIALYESVFSTRFETRAELLFRVEDFEGLKAEKHVFASDKGQKLTGYRYYMQEETQGLVVLAHGFGGGGHNNYMDVCAYFAKNGLDVFAYDATANDESEGKSVGGLEQGVIDLNYALTYLSGLERYRNIPMALFGHSWGGYSVGAVLNYHPEVKAVVSVAGFNRASDLVRAQGEMYIGGYVHLAMPYVELHERTRFGKYASATAVDGMKNSSAAVMILQSKDDETVPVRYGYNVYYKEFANDARFRFKLYDDKGHNNILYSNEGREYLQTLSEEAARANEGKENREAFWEYIETHLDRERYANMLDEELFSEILAFYRENLW